MSCQCYWAWDIPFPLPCPLRTLELRWIDRQLAQSRSGRGKDRVGYCRSDRRGSSLAHPPRWLGAVHDVNLDRWRLVHPQHPVIVEIALLDTTGLEGDLSIQRRRDPEDARALDLRLDRIRIDDSAAIHRADDAPDTNRPVARHFDFGNLRHIRREDELDGDAATNPL